MQRLTFLLLALAIYSGIAAKSVAVEKAEKVALHFYISRHHSDSRYATSVLFTGSSSYINKDGLPLYYVFNVKDDRGFVVVAADDCVRPVIAYAFEGKFIINDNNKGMQWFMQKYRQQIEQAISEGIKASPEIRREWQELLQGESQGALQAVNPLLNTSWDQNCYYNLYLPNDMSGPCNHVYTGCVATAMAQVMKYHNFPATGYGTHSYTHPSYGTLSANFGSTTYLWSQMPPQLSSSSSLSEKQAVARLMQHCGIAVDMNYGPNGSGTSTAFTMDAFADFFRYNYSVFELDAAQYSNQEWQALLRDQLDHSLPMIYSGTDYSIGYGHAWVCDGYQGSSYFHMNWGWSGSGNGYFQLNNLSAGGSNFTADQQAVINIKPSGSVCNGNTTFLGKRGHIEDGSGPANYAANQSCSWLIQPAATSSIVLTFSEFQTEQGQDIVKVYDGNSTSGTLLGAFSGNNLPPMLVANSGAMYITFSTNGSVNKAGWKASWSDQLPVYCTNLKLMTATTATIEDGSQSNNYLNNTQCKWLLRPAGASYVALNFREFDLHPTDHVYVYNGSNTGSPLLGSFTGSTLPPHLQSTGNSMLVYFVAGPTGTGKGWMATYYKNDMAVNSIKAGQGPVLYPNPAQDKIHIKLPKAYSGPINISLLDLSGRRVQQQDYKNTTASSLLSLDISSLSPGTYFVKMITEHYTSIKTIVKQ